jgi:hypothetical protein
MLRRIVPLLFLAALAATAQKYDGPRPPKPDLPYIKQADNLIPTEVTEAKQEQKKKDIIFVIEGATSSARTPLASPIFLIHTEKLNADKLQLFRMESKNGRRELLMSARKPATPFHIEVTRLAPDNLYRIEVDESLAPGEYSLSPSDSNVAFCFQVF